MINYDLKFFFDSQFYKYLNNFVSRDVENGSHFANCEPLIRSLNILKHSNYFRLTSKLLQMELKHFLIEFV